MGFGRSGSVDMLGRRDPLAASLEAGERVLWRGRPPRRLVLLRRDDLYLIPFSLVFLALVSGTLFGADPFGIPPVDIGEGEPPSPLFRFVFALVTFHLVIGRFIVDWLGRLRTHYAVTDRRVLIVRTPPFGEVTSLDRLRLPPVTVLTGRDHRGTIRFGADIEGKGEDATIAAPRFEGIDHAQEVRALIEQRPGRRR